MKEEWYELILEDYKNLGVEKFTELVEDAEYQHSASKILNPIDVMWGWDSFEEINKIFNDAY